MLARAGIVTVCIYRSTPEHVSQFAGKHVSARSLALSDRKGTVYDAFSVKRSTAAVLIRGQIQVLKDYSKIKQFVPITIAISKTRARSTRGGPTYPIILVSAPKNAVLHILPGADV